MAHGTNAHRAAQAKGRLFEIKTIPNGDDGTRRRVQFTTCSRCGTEGAVTDSPGSSLPGEVIEKKLKRLGWLIGSKPRHDVCPECVGKIQDERRSKHNTHTPETKENEPMTTKPLPPRVTPIQMPSADADSLPVSMTREHRRIIFEKLNEVYLNETVGYAEGHTDKTVAADLGCPEKWVAEIRAENFGDVKSNEGMIAFLAEAEKLAGRAQEVLTEAAAHHTAMQKIIGDAQNIGGKIKVIQMDLERLNKKGAEIAIALGK